MTARTGQATVGGNRVGWRRRLRRRIKASRRRLMYGLAIVVIPLSQVLPVDLLLRIGELAGALAYRLRRRERELAREHLRVSLGDRLGPVEREGVVRRMFTNLGQYAAELLLLARRPPTPLWRRTEAEEFYRHVDAIRSRGRGMIILTGHIGNWELAGWVFGQHFSPPPPTVLARRLYYEPFNRLVVGVRRRLGMRVHYRDSSPRDLMRRLARGEAMATLVDQDINDIPGVFVRFFGRPAYTVSGPMSLALRTGTPVLLAALVRTRRGRYRMLSQPFELEVTGNREQDVQVNTQRWSDWFEDVIGTHPDQWPWYHARWRTTEELLERKRRQWASGTRRRR